MGNYLSEQYWEGPYGIKVPTDVMFIVDADGGNTLSQNGGCTEMLCLNPPTENGI